MVISFLSSILKQIPLCPSHSFIFVRTLLTSKLSCLSSESINNELTSSGIKGALILSYTRNPTTKSMAYCNAPLGSPLTEHRRASSMSGNSSPGPRRETLNYISFTSEEIDPQKLSFLSTHS